MKPFYFEHILVVPDQGEIRNGQEAFQLQPKIMSVLQYLVERQGEVITKNELIEQVWQERIVADDVLTNAIWVIRNALGDDARNPKFIKTIPRKGYLLLVKPSFRLNNSLPKAENLLVADAPTEPPIKPSDKANPLDYQHQSLNIGWLSILIILLISLTLYWVLLGQQSKTISPNATIVDNHSSKKDTASTNGNAWSFKAGEQISQMLEFEQKIITAALDHYIYLHETQSGKELWRANINGKPVSQLQRMNGQVSIISSDGYQYVFDWQSGRELSRVRAFGLNAILLTADGYWFVNDKYQQYHKSIKQLVASVSTLDEMTSGTAYYLDHGALFISKGGEISSWDRNSTNANWSFHANSSISPKIVIENDRLYFTTTSGYLYALDLISGQEQWRKEYKGRLLSPVANDAGQIAVASVRGLIALVSMGSGKEYWQAELNSRPTAIGFENQQLLVSLQNKDLVLFDLSSGKPVSQWQTSSTISDWIVGDDLFVIGTQDGTLCRSKTPNIPSIALSEDSCVTVRNSTQDYQVKYFSDSAPPEMLWRVRTEGVLEPAALLMQNKIFYGDDEYVYSRQIDNGALNWRFKLSGDIGTNVVAFQENLFFGARDGYLYCINQNSGKEQWRFITGSDVISSPTIDNGIVYFGSQDNSLYAVNAKTGKEYWRYKTGNMVNSAPAVTKGLVVFGSGDQHVYALDKRSGEPIWHVDVGSWVVDRPLITNDGQSVIIGSHHGVIRALSVTDGSEQWQFKTGGKIWYGKSQDQDAVYVGSGDGYLYKVNKLSGKEIWRFDTKGVANYDTRIIDNLVIASNEDGKVYAIDKTTGIAQWHFSTRGEMRNAIVNQQYLAVGSTDFYLYVLQLHR